MLKVGFWLPCGRGAHAVIPAKAGIKFTGTELGRQLNSRLRGNDGVLEAATTASKWDSEVKKADSPGNTCASSYLIDSDLLRSLKAEQPLRRIPKYLLPVLDIRHQLRKQLQQRPVIQAPRRFQKWPV
jgi:hypothetical protein